MNPTTRIWLPEDAEQLKSLRLAAGLDIAILAKRHSLSVHQVRQLEEGGVDLFYSQAIKLQVGRKLLRALGGELLVLSPVPDSAQTANAESSVMPEPVHASVVVKEATLSTGLPRSSGRLWIPLGGVALVALAWLGWQQAVSAPSSSKKNIQSIAPEPKVSSTQAEVVPTQDAPDLLSQEGEQNALDPNDTMSATASDEDEPQTPTAATNPSNPECTFGSEPRRVSVFEPRKPGNYVYFEAQQAVTLCVRDAAQQVTALELSAGRGRTVRGAAPFEVLSQHFQDMRIYYQGKLVAPGMLNQPHIVLRPQAVMPSTSETELN